MLDRIEQLVEGRKWHVDDDTLFGDADEFVDEPDPEIRAQEIRKAQGRANPNWKPLSSGGYRATSSERNQPSHRTLSDIAIQPYFPHDEVFNAAGYERLRRRVETLDAAKEKRSLTSNEQTTYEHAKMRMERYHFFQKTQASQEVALHGKTPLEAVLKYSPHHRALTQGKMPLDLLAMTRLLR
jgi:hypothetical protein